MTNGRCSELWFVIVMHFNPVPVITDTHRCMQRFKQSADISGQHFEMTLAHRFTLNCNFGMQADDKFHGFPSDEQNKAKNYSRKLAHAATLSTVPPKDYTLLTLRSRPCCGILYRFRFQYSNLRTMKHHESERSG